MLNGKPAAFYRLHSDWFTYIKHRNFSRKDAKKNKNLATEGTEGTEDTEDTEEKVLFTQRRKGAEKIISYWVVASFELRSKCSSLIDQNQLVASFSIFSAPLRLCVK